MLADETDISGTAEYFGVSLRTLRFYEELGLVKPIRRGTARFYTNGDRLRLQLIATGKRMGMGLSQIGKLITEAEMSRLSADKPSAAPPGSIAELLTKDEIQQQLQVLERQRQDVETAVAELKKLQAFEM